jgi:hypothetical protein
VTDSGCFDLAETNVQPVVERVMEKLRSERREHGKQV